MNNLIKFLISFVISLIIILIFRDNPFFWDTILYNRIAQFYIETDFNSFFLPEYLDTGHPPVYPFLLAKWILFAGNNLMTAHLFQLPAIILTIFYGLKLTELLTVNKKYLYLFPLLLLADPTVLAQFSLVSLDVYLTGFYLTALYYILKNNSQQPQTKLNDVLLCLMTVLLVLFNLRGVVMVGSLFVCDVLLTWYQTKKISLKILKRVIPYIVSGIVLIGYGYFHTKMTGWTFTTPSEEWKGGRQLVDKTGLIKNIIVIAWRFMDYGRFAIIIPVLILIFTLRKKVFSDNKTVSLLLCIIVPILIISGMMILVTNPICHRYFMTFFILGIILFLVLIQSLKRSLQIGLICLAFIVQISGHFWIYPNEIAQGWDSSLAHLPFFKLRKEAFKKIDQLKIPYNEIGTAFPLKSSDKDIYMKGDTSKLSYFEMSKHKYVLISNVINDIKAPGRGKEIFIITKNGVYISLYERE